ncbi:MAG: GNAT family N-acetyltransferase [Acidimicrobiales bacterium]
MDFVCEVFSDAHDASGFTSGQSSLDEWLRGSARDSDGRNLTRTYVWHIGDGVVVAYYAMMPYCIERANLSSKQGRGLPERIACYLIARLALCTDLQRQRLGSQLLASALERAARGSAELGGRYVVVDAIDETAHAFYRHHGFQPVPGHDNRLILATKALEPYISRGRRPPDVV